MASLVVEMLLIEDELLSEDARQKLIDDTRRAVFIAVPTLDPKMVQVRFMQRSLDD